MIIGIGSDLASVERIADTLAAHGARFIDRCYAPAERDHVEARAAGMAADAALAARAGGYAKRWAAKEACAKALGCGIRDGIHLRDIVVTNDAAGKPSILLQGGAAAHLAGLVPPGRTASLHLTMSDDQGFALAFVVISAD